jgi:hypothetical protein
MAVKAGSLPAQRVDPLGRRRGLGKHGRLNLVDVVFQPGYHGGVSVDHVIHYGPQHRRGPCGKQVRPLLQRFRAAPSSLGTPAEQ